MCVFRLCIHFHINKYFSAFHFFHPTFFFFVKGSELDDFVSGPRELLLKFVEENYPLPEKAQLLPGLRLFCQMILICFHYCGLILYIYIYIYIYILIYNIGEDGVKELQRKRHSATPDVSLKGRVRKSAKLQPPSDAESDEESESESPRSKVDESFVYITFFLLCFNCIWYGGHETLSKSQTDSFFPLTHLIYPFSSLTNSPAHHFPLSNWAFLIMDPVNNPLPPNFYCPSCS